MTKCTQSVHFVQKHAKTRKMAKIAIFHVFRVFESIWKPVKMLTAGFEKTVKMTKYIKTLYHLQFLCTHVFV